MKRILLVLIASLTVGSTAAFSIGFACKMVSGSADGKAYRFATNGAIGQPVYSLSVRWDDRENPFLFAKGSVYNLVACQGWDMQLDWENAYPDFKTEKFHCVANGCESAICYNQNVNNYSEWVLTGCAGTLGEAE